MGGHARTRHAHTGGGETDARETDAQTHEGRTRANPARTHRRRRNRRAQNRRTDTRGTDTREPGTHTQETAKGHTDARETDAQTREGQIPGIARHEVRRSDYCRRQCKGEVTSPRGDRDCRGPVTAELNAVDTLQRTHGAAVCLVCAAIEITHRRFVASGVIQASVSVTGEQVHEQMRLERRDLAKMGTQAFTLTCLTANTREKVAATPRHRFGSHAAAIQGCTFRRDDKLFTVHDVHIRQGSKTEHAIYARNMSRALTRDEQKGPFVRDL